MSKYQINLDIQKIENLENILKSFNLFGNFYFSY